jgi:hypothetical protein
MCAAIVERGIPEDDPQEYPVLSVISSKEAVVKEFCLPPAKRTANEGRERFHGINKLSCINFSGCLLQSV